VLALQVEVDGQRVAVAGFSDWALLSVHITANRGIPGAAAEPERQDRTDLRVGGLSQPDNVGIAYHCRWGNIDLHVGSRVQVTLVETGQPDPPIKRYRSDSTVQENPFTEKEMRDFRWQEYLLLKKEFEGPYEAKP
jgi:hypothetical protein